MRHVRSQLLSLLAAILVAPPAMADGDQQFAEFADCPLLSGAKIENCRIGYRTFGTLNADKTNAVLFPTWFGGTTGDFVAYGTVGPGRFANSDEYFVIAVDAFGNGVSSSPSNSDTQPGSRFPEVRIGDMVIAQRRLLTERLGIQHLHAVIGISMGGMQAYDWIVRYPDFMTRAVSVVGTPRQTSYDILSWNAQLETILNVADKDHEQAVRLVASLDTLASYTPAYVASNTPAADADAYLEQAVASIRNRGLADRVPQLRAMIAQDISADFDGSMEKAAQHVAAKLLIIVSPGDHMVNPIPSREFAALSGASLVELPGLCGHLAVACESDRMTDATLEFLRAAE